MEVKEVVKIATSYLVDVFSSERLSNVGLEEITFDEDEKVWKVTVGFSRPWDYQEPGFASSLQPKQPNRQYKVVEVDDTDGNVKAITMRE